MPTAPPDASAAALRAAFEDLHGGRLHGFALLVTLGDRHAAARLARGALVAAGARTGELRHPERAGAWLRAWVVRTAGGRHRVPQAPADHYRALAELGIGEATLDSLATLDPRERAAIVASVVERFDRRDVATIVGRDGAALDRLLVRARRRFMRAHAARSPDTSPPGGPYVDRLAAVASHALR